MLYTYCTEGYYTYKTQMTRQIQIITVLKLTSLNCRKHVFILPQIKVFRNYGFDLNIQNNDKLMF